MELLKLLYEFSVVLLFFVTTGWLFVGMQRVLVLVATDVDALCACKILQVSYYIVCIFVLCNLHTIHMHLIFSNKLYSMHAHRLTTWISKLLSLIFSLHFFWTFCILLRQTRDTFHIHLWSSLGSSTSIVVQRLIRIGVIFVVNLSAS